MGKTIELGEISKERKEALAEKVEIFFNSPRVEKKAVARASNPSAPGIKKMSPTHEAIINWFLENPGRSQRDCATVFGVTQAWLSTLVHSDAFQERLARRQDEMAALVGLSLTERITAAAEVAVEGLTRKLEECEDPAFLLDATDKLCHRLGFAPRGQGSAAPGTATTNNTQINIVASAEDLRAARALMAGGKSIATTGEIPAIPLNSPTGGGSPTVPDSDTK